MGALFVIAGLAIFFLFVTQSQAQENSDVTHPKGMIGMLSYSDLQSLAASAGFGTDSDIAAAVALAESGGDPQAYNPETAAGASDGMGSYGLWQIYLNKHPEFAGQDLTDPATNAAAAFSVYMAAGESFRPWSTFKSGAYQKYLQASA